MSAKKSFTLVEILVVIAILGLLMLVAFSNIQNYRIRAQTNACVSNLHAIGNGVSLWAMDNGKSGNDTVQMADLVPAYLKSTPYCSLDSAKKGYVLTVVSQDPACPCDPQGHKLD